eukprot:CAMPEP_0116557500 /NCGR_PEP_ID=MMETSP0397-20121206/9276_1 /TAXON_ID=216820 /ORGANISM="Cyclophora tenuis, Strain ECT3854" /LENGTH=251 /DNA_ID=CAMNT_0004082967 /DNA_START=334 /DNA_END=1086 /DNA_ORIENTATION=-
MSLYSANQQIIKQHQEEQEALYSKQQLGMLGLSAGEEDNKTTITDDDTTFDDEGEDDNVAELGGFNKRSSLIDKKRGFGKHRHPWLEKEHDFQDDDDCMSLAGMVSLGDSSTGTHKSRMSQQNKKGMFTAPKSHSMRRESRGSFGSKSVREKMDEDDDGASAPMAPPRRKHIPNVPDIPEDIPDRDDDEADGIMRDVDLSSYKQQAAGEAATQSTADAETTYMVETQSLHSAPPPGMSVRAPKQFGKKSFW